MSEIKLPAQIVWQEYEAARIEREIERHMAAHPKPGPEPVEKEPTPLVALAADTEQELDRLLSAFNAVIGRPARGNKRLGLKAMYAELVEHFFYLKRLGITLPKNKSLSAAACSHGLGEILRRHKKTTYSDTELLTNGQKRLEVASKMDRVFGHVASYVENTPA